MNKKIMSILITSFVLFVIVGLISFSPIYSNSNFENISNNNQELYDLLDEQGLSPVKEFLESAGEYATVDFFNGTILNGVTTGDIDLGSTYNRSSSWIVPTWTTDSNTDSSAISSFTWFWANDTAVTYARNTGSYDFNYSLWVIEFSQDADFDVYEYTNIDAAENKTITAVDPDHAFTFYSGNTCTSATGYDPGDWAVLEMDSSTNVHVRGGSEDVARQYWNDVAFQVISSPNIDVQRSTFSHSPAQINVTISTVEPTSSLVITGQTDDGINSGWLRHAITAYVSNATNIYFESYSADAAFICYWQVIDFNDILTVQNKEGSWDSNDYQETVDFDTAVDTDHAFCITSGGKGGLSFGGMVGALGDDTPVAFFVNYFLDSDSVFFRRGNWEYSENAATFMAQLIEFNIDYQTPVNDETPNLTNPTDTDYMYSEYVQYIITSNVSDANGYVDIDYVEFGIWDNTRSTEYFTIRYNESTNTFSEQSGSTYIDLDTSGSSYEKSGSDLDITWKLNVTYLHVDALLIDAKQYVVDDSSLNDTDWYEVNWNIETDLTISGYNIQDEKGASSSYWYRGNYNSTAFGVGNLVYQGTSTYPNGIDVWISSSTLNKATGPFSDLVITSGDFNVTVDADDIIGEDTYIVKAVADGDGSGGTDLIVSGTQSDTFIADAIEYYIISTPNDHVGLNVEADCYVWIRYAYDSLEISSLGSSSVWIDTEQTSYFNLNHVTGKWWETSPSYGYTRTNNYTARASSESQFGLSTILVTANPSYDTTTWDQVRILDVQVENGLDTRVDVDGYSWFEMQMDWESSEYGWVDETDVGGSWPLILGPDATWYSLDTYMGSGWWRGNITSTTAIAYEFETWIGNVVNPNTPDGIGATSYYDGHRNSTIWDRMNVTITPNTLHTIYGNNITLDYSVVYDYDGSAWSGVFTWADQYPIESTVISRLINETYVTSVTDSTYGLTNWFVNSPDTVIWDDIDITSVVAYWVQESETRVYLIWNPSTYYWEYDDSAIADSPICKIFAYMNGTEGDWAILSGSTHSDLAIGQFNPDWYYANITVNATITIDGIDYDWQIWSHVYEVDILHSLQIVSFSIEPTDYYFWIQYQSNLLNGSIAIWDDAIDSGTLYSDAIYTSDSEGMHSIDRSTIVGTHNVTICINSDGVEYDRVYTEDDYVWWYNFTYIVSDSLTVSDTMFTLATQLQLSGTVNVACNYYVFSNDTYQSVTGALTTGSFAITWTKETDVALHLWAVKFNTSSYTRWVNGSYDVSSTALQITDTVYSETSTQAQLSGYVTIACNYYVFENDTYMSVSGAASIGSISVTWTKQTDVGLYEWAIKFNTTTTTRWVNGSYDVSSTSFLISDTLYSETTVEAEISAFSNLDCTYKVFENDTLRESGSLSAGSIHVDWPKQTTIGVWSWGVQFNSSGTIRWVNGSYDVTGTYDTCHIYTYDAGGDYIDWEQFIFLVNGTQIEGNEFYNRTDYTYSIIVQDQFGVSLSTDTYSFKRTIRIALDVYTFMVTSMLDDQFIYFNLTRQAGGTWSRHLSDTSDLIFELYDSATYTYEYTTISTDGSIRTHSGSVTITADTTLVIVSSGIHRIISEILLISPGGGGVSKDYVEKQFNEIDFSLGLMWTYLWGFGIVMVVLIWLAPYIGKRGSYAAIDSTGKPPSKGRGSPKKRDPPKERSGAQILSSRGKVQSDGKEQKFTARSNT